MNEVDLSLSEPYVCDECGHDVFKATYKLRSIPGVATMSGEPTIAPIQVFQCTKCDHINKEWLPQLPEDNEGGNLVL